MYRLILKLLWNALPLVALILIGWWLYNTFTNPPPAPPTKTLITDRRGVVEAIEQVNKQIFIEHYNIVDVQYTEAPEGWISALGLKQEVVVLVRGLVPAGFDIQQITEEDIWISSDGKRAQLTLPSPMVFEENVSLDLENSRILIQNDTCPNFLCEDTLEAYQEEVLPAGKALLIEYAYENGILRQAARDGKAYYEQLLKSLGFNEVRVIVDGYD
jgi:hypothetical protein